MPYLVVKSASNATPESYQLTSTWGNPKLALKTYNTSTSSYSYSVATTVLASSSNSEGMSNTSSVSSSFTSGTQALTSQGTNTLYQQTLTANGTYTKAAYSNTSKYMYDLYAIATSTKTQGMWVQISGSATYTQSMTLSTISANGSTSAQITEFIYSTGVITNKYIPADVESTYKYMDSWTCSPLFSSIIAETTGTSTLTGSSSYYSGAVNSTTSESASVTCYTNISNVYIPFSTNTFGAGLKVMDSNSVYKILPSILVDIPVVTVGTYTYNGSDQGPSVSNLDTDYVDMINEKNTNAGTYTLTLSLKNPDCQMWSDNTTADKTYTYTINKATVAVPTVTNTSLTYSGGSQGPTITGFDSTKMTKSGDTGTNAGDYTVTFTLIDSSNYQWESGSTSVAWTIAKANQSVTVSTNSVSLSSSQTYADVTITHSGGGTFSISSGNTGIATVANTSGNTYRITGVANGSTTITASMAGNSNYNAASASISVSVSMLKIVTWAGGTDAEIVAMVAAADRGEINLSDYWHVGDERVVNVSAMSARYVGETHVAQTITFVLMHAGLYNLTSAVASGRTKCSFVVGMKAVLTPGGYMNGTATNSGSWKNCARRKWCNEIFKNALPSTLVSIFKQFKTVTIAVYNGSTTETTDDYFAVFAEKEIFGSGAWVSALAERNALTQFTYFQNITDKTFHDYGSTGNVWYWMRSSSQYDSTKWVCTDGVNGHGLAADVATSGYRTPVFGCI